MLELSQGGTYRDCTREDFSRYFLHTYMVWNLSPTKKRIFRVEDVNHHEIEGEYLTREKEWKSKMFSFDTWWNSLDAIAVYPRLFNTKVVGCWWMPNLGSNFKKSFPSALNTLQVYGSPPAGAVTTQELIRNAFGEVYKIASLPSLSSALQDTSRQSTATKEGFVFYRSVNQLFYKGSLVAGVNNQGEIFISKKNRIIKNLLLKCGIQESKIKGE